MKVLRTLLFCWLSLGLCVSGWAFSPTTCAAVGNESAMTSQGHEHHAKATVESAAAHHAGAASALPGQDELAGPSECCDTCATACTMGVTAISGDLQFVIWSFHRHKFRTVFTGLYNDPRSHPPFRPPILTP